MNNFFKIITDFFSGLFGHKDAMDVTLKTDTELSVEHTSDPVLEPLTPVEPVKKWFVPIREDKFNKVTQQFLEPNPHYKITGHHPGVDYGTQGEDNVPLFFCADGEVVDCGFTNSCGNYFFYYVPEVDRTFVYFHLRDKAPVKGVYKGGEQCGITGSTGDSTGIHLHLECMKGKQNLAKRGALYTSVEAIAAAGEDANAFIRARL